MTDIKTDLGRDALEHFGVLGMKWGHRKEDSWGSKKAKNVRLVWRGDMKKVKSAMQSGLKRDLPKINKRPEFRNLASQPSAVKRQYRKAVTQSLQSSADKAAGYSNRRNTANYAAAVSVIGLVSPILGVYLWPDPIRAGRRDLKKSQQAQHSAMNETEALAVGVYTFDDNEYITGITFIDDPEKVRATMANAEIEHSDFDTEDFLAHYGVLGMRWGYRKDELAIAKADAKFERKAVTKGLSRRKYVRAVNRAIKGFNKDIHDINKSPTFRNKDLTNKNDPVTRQYFELVQKTFEDHLAAASRKLPTNYSGTRQFRLNPSFDNRWPTVSVVDISASPADVDAQHSSVSDSNDTAPPAPMPLKAIFDQLGKVVRIEELVEEPIVMHSEEIGEEFLEHFGILGMRWGYRKADNILAPKPQAPQEPKKLGPIQKHELNQLSNDEVKQVIERINLEKQLREAMTEPAKPKGQSWIQQNAGPLASKAAVTAATTATTMAIKWYFDGKKDKQKSQLRLAEELARDAAKAARKAKKASEEVTNII